MRRPLFAFGLAGAAAVMAISGVLFFTVSNPEGPSYEPEPATQASVVHADEAPQDRPQLIRLFDTSGGSIAASAIGAPGVALFRSDEALTVAPANAWLDEENAPSEYDNVDGPAVAAAFSGTQLLSVHAGMESSLAVWVHLAQSPKAEPLPLDATPIDLWAVDGGAWVLTRTAESGTLHFFENKDGTVTPVSHSPVGATPVGFFAGPGTLLAPMFMERELAIIDPETPAAEPRIISLAGRPLLAVAAFGEAFVAAANDASMERIDGDATTSFTVPAPITSAAGAADALFGYAASDGTLYRFDENLAVTRESDAFPNLTALALSPCSQGHWLLAASDTDEPALLLIDTQTLEEVARAPVNGRPDRIRMHDGVAIVVSPVDGGLAAFKLPFACER